MLNDCSIFLFRQRAYFPTLASLSNSRSYVLVHPVFVSELVLEPMLIAFEQLVKQGHPTGPNPLTADYWKTYRSPLNEATGIKSTKTLDKQGLTYTISWERETISLFVPSLDRSQRAKELVGIQHIFPHTTPIQEIFIIILEHREKIINHNNHAPLVSHAAKK